MKGFKNNKDEFIPTEPSKKVGSDSVNQSTEVESTSFEKQGKSLQMAEPKSKMTFSEFLDSGRYLEDEVRRRSDKKGGHFFDADTMKFFSSRISELMWSEGDIKDYQTEPIYFITSEKDTGHIQHSGSVRAFTVRRIDEGGDITKVSNFQGISTLNDARHEIKDILNGDEQE